VTPGFAGLQDASALAGAKRAPPQGALTPASPYTRLPVKSAQRSLPGCARVKLPNPKPMSEARAGFSAEELLQSAGKGKPLPAVVEAVANGSTLRVSLLPELTPVTVLVAETQVPPGRLCCSRGWGYPRGAPNALSEQACSAQRSSAPAALSKFQAARLIRLGRRACLCRVMPGTCCQTPLGLQASPAGARPRCASRAVCGPE